MKTRNIQYSVIVITYLHKEYNYKLYYNVLYKTNK